MKQFLDLVQQSVKREDALKDLHTLMGSWRKKCINNVSAQEELRELGAAESVVKFLGNLCQSNCIDALTLGCMKVGVTFLSNFLTMNERNQEYLWGICFPKWFSSVLNFAIANQERQLLAYLCMLTYNGICNSSLRRQDLIQSLEGQEIIKVLLDAAVVNGKAAEDDAFDWIYLIVKSLYEFLPVFFPKLYFGAEPDHVHSQEQLSIISLLDISVEKNEVKPQVIQTLCPFLVKELDGALTFIIARERKRIPIYGIGLNRPQMIKSLLTTLASVAQNHQQDVDLVSLGLVETLVTLLGHCQQASQTEDNVSDVNFKSVLNGLKSETIRILANLSFNNKHCQDLVRQLGGLALILSNCMFDDDNNYLREWSILALRNLCLENPDNQQFVASLKALAVPPKVQQEMNRQGFRVEISPEGTVTLVKEFTE